MKLEKIHAIKRLEIWVLRGLKNGICNFCTSSVYLWEGGWGSFFVNKIFVFKIVCSKVNLVFLEIVLIRTYFRDIAHDVFGVTWDWSCFLSQSSFLLLETGLPFLGPLHTRVFLQGVILNVGRKWPTFFFSQWVFLVNSGFSCL